MTARALIKSPTAQRSSPSSTSPGGSTPQLPNQSVQADGMRDRLPSGSTTNNNGTPCRVSPLITARRHPSKGCRLRVMTTEVGKSWEWVVCGVFVRHDSPRCLMRCVAARGLSDQRVLQSDPDVAGLPLDDGRSGSRRSSGADEGATFRRAARSLPERKRQFLLRSGDAA